MPDRPVRVTVVMTHPVQYFAPWFRFIAAERPDVALTVLYAVRPTAEAQADGYATAFEWDVPLLEGYEARVLAAEPWPEPLLASGFSRVDAPGLAGALAETAPDAVVVPGWHSAVYLRAMRACRQLGVPTLYRGDSHLGTAPRGLRRLAWRSRTRWRLSRFDAWLAVGTRSREYLASFGVPEPLVFDSPHAVDNARFEAAAARLASPGARRALREGFGLTPGAFVVLLAGRVSAGKRPLDLIEAAAAAGGGVEVLVAGTGDAEAACRARAAALGVRIAFAGFLNQTRMPEAFAAADCLAMPSQRETWGLVVNEALASGRPVIVSAGAGAAPDLARGPAGMVVPVADVAALAAAIVRMRERTAGMPELPRLCREAVAPYSFARATDGLVAACARLARREPARRDNRDRPTRVLALCGHMVIPGGLERMTVGVLAALRARGAGAHAIVNGWESSAVVALIERAGVSWSTGRYYATFSRRPSAAAALAMAWDLLATSAGMVRAARTLDCTHVLVPEPTAVLRNWPALAWLRFRGIPVVMRLGNAPPPGAFYRRLWRWAIAPVVSRFVANSRFIAAEVVATGIDAARVEVVLNAPTSRGGPAPVPGYLPDVDSHRVIYVGQVIPPKGVDVLLDAVALVRGRGVPATLEVVGDMDGWEAPAYAGYRARLRARAAEPDLAGAVTFAGYQTDVATRFARAAVHCCPSLPAQREGLAGVVLEAKAAGVPSVVAPTGSLPELVEDGVDGWIAAEATAPAIADALHAALGDRPRLALAAAAARRSLVRFSHERFEAAWARVFGVSDATRTPAGNEAEAGT